MWNLEPYVHNSMTIAEAHDRAEFAQMGINKESSEPVRGEREPSTEKGCARGRAGWEVNESWSPRMWGKPDI